MTSKQIKWASGHDWYITSSESSITVKDDNIAGGQLNFKSGTFSELCKWAGY